MQQISVTGIESNASIVGFGCASLGSRVGRRAGLNLLNRAFDAGITWFDVAPSYGDAEAETILGEFARARRDKMQICTKVGFVPAQKSFATRAAKPILRFSVNAIPMLRKYVAKVRPSAAKRAISAEVISRSVDASLQRLRTDYIEVLGLHGAEPDEIVREDVLAALDRIVRLGKVKTISIASSLESGLHGVANSSIYGIIQLANNPFQPSLAQLAGQLPEGTKITFVTHSAFGALGALSRLREIIESNVTKQQILRDEGYHGNAEQTAAAFLADYALATNRAGITLFSMLKENHLDFNLRRLARLPEKAHIEEMGRRLIA